MGSTSYAPNEQKWRAEGAYTESSHFNPCNSTANMANIRAQNWVLARTKTNDKRERVISNEKTRQVKQSIDEWQSKVAEGEFLPNRTDDVLNRALKRKKHPGRTLGLGVNTRIKDAFGPSKRYNFQPQVFSLVSSLEFQNVLQQELKKIMAQWGMSIHKDVDVEQNNPSQPDPIVKSSCQYNNLACLEGVHKCNLSSIIQGERVVVAHGQVHLDQSIMHSRPIPPENVVVCLDGYVAEYGHCSLPVPSDAVQTINEAVGSFMQWPRHLVNAKLVGIASAIASVSCPKNPNPVNRISNDITTLVLSKNCKVLEPMVSSLKALTAIQVPDEYRDIVHPQNKENVIYIFPESIKELLSFKEIDASCIEVFMIALTACVHTQPKRSSKQEFKYIYVKCARQTCLVECGYMHDIVVHNGESQNLAKNKFLLAEKQIVTANPDINTIELCEDR